MKGVDHKYKMNINVQKEKVFELPKVEIYY